MRRLPILASGLALLLAAGCTQTEGGTPAAETPSAATSGTADSPADEVPVVTEPLDPSAYLDDPCRLAPQAVLANLGFEKPGETQNEANNSATELTGPGCSWSNRGSAEMIAIGVQTEARKDGPGGLRHGYQLYTSGEWFGFWEFTTVDDYPAAYADVDDRRDRGQCNLMVGIADDLSFYVAASGYFDEPDKACESAHSVAGAVIDTLKGGS
ncbi:DUF3558 domain-containing protein [Prauserella cavernicola]|nr:DUF3558 domain-containing protein [Prauserella cavernicola]